MVLQLMLGIGSLWGVLTVMELELAVKVGLLYSDRLGGVLLLIIKLLYI